MGWEAASLPPIEVPRRCGNGIALGSLRPRRAASLIDLSRLLLPFPSPQQSALSPSDDDDDDDDGWQRRRCRPDVSSPSPPPLSSSLNPFLLQGVFQGGFLRSSVDVNEDAELHFTPSLGHYTGRR